MATGIVGQLPEKRWFAEIRALFNFVRDNVRYTLDVNEVETLQTPEATLALRVGDCDDMAVLLASLLESVGHPTAFQAIAFKPEEFEHVFTVTRGAGEGPWIALDPTEPYPAGWCPPGIVDTITVHNRS